MSNLKQTLMHISAKVIMDIQSIICHEKIKRSKVMKGILPSAQDYLVFSWISVWKLKEKSWMLQIHLWIRLSPAKYKLKNILQQPRILIHIHIHPRYWIRTFNLKSEPNSHWCCSTCIHPRIWIRVLTILIPDSENHDETTKNTST